MGKITRARIADNLAEVKSLKDDFEEYKKPVVKLNKAFKKYDSALSDSDGIPEHAYYIKY